MQIDSLALQMRPRAPHEAADLGIRLCQANAGAVYRCFLAVAVPLSVVALALFEYSPWYPVLFLWCAKPWLDRTVLFVLSRAAFGQSTTLADLWREQRAVWWRQLITTWTLRRLSPWRSLTQPVYQLEGHSFFGVRKRIAQLRNRYSGAAFSMTCAFLFATVGLTMGVVSLTAWAASPEQDTGFWSLLLTLLRGDWTPGTQFMAAFGYITSSLFLEPFYVAAGFGMYLNRRAELEAWDIEQEFRRAFAS